MRVSPSLSRSGGDAERSERRGCPPPSSHVILNEAQRSEESDTGDKSIATVASLSSTIQCNIITSITPHNAPIHNDKHSTQPNHHPGSRVLPGNRLRFRQISTRQPGPERHHPRRQRRNGITQTISYDKDFDPIPNIQRQEPTATP